MVRTLLVISSPVSPSPRVAALIKTPFSYNKLIAKPSSFTSQQYAISSSIFNLSRTRLSKTKTSSVLNALSNDSMGTRCFISANADAALMPTRWVGESGVINSG